MNILLSQPKFLLRGVLRKFYYWQRLVRQPGAKGGSVDPSVKLIGSGRPVLGDRVRLEEGVEIAIGSRASVNIGAACAVRKFTRLEAAAGAILTMEDQSRVGSHSYLCSVSKFVISSRSWIGSCCSIAAREEVEQPGKFFLGEGSAINERAYIDLSADCIIGKNVTVGREVTIHTHSHKYAEGKEAAWKSPVELGAVTIRDGAWVGTRVTILAGVTVGRMAVVAAGAIVTKDIPDHGVYAGVPARPVRGK